MLKYAFIADAPGVVPETYFTTYEYDDCLNLIVGTPNMETTEKLVKKLEKEGFSMMNFCGAFDEEKMNRLKSLQEGTIKMSAVKYLPQEQEKMDKLKSFKNWGVIIEGTEELTEMNLPSEKSNLYIYFVKDMDMAKEAATKLVEKDVFFIELCGWFKADMTKEIINHIDGALPVGSAGL